MDNNAGSAEGLFEDVGGGVPVSDGATVASSAGGAAVR